ncbi:hypothetical protein HYH02_015233 [Chlamydomonas schloesseri]|uniref:Protein VACUOLELESS1 n=1 Tax=Chlamydomonas schloesseri TaxID=2026947 RepID=A0A835SFW3_9CHLO|nr:hypothetical protein HYH02_015233 [Chlamydomonas schloesseri]|eukprot:KAG2424052.1 hypothetical protein HYH02_015233 [Chlamydomonas schloesseri]
MAQLKTQAVGDWEVVGDCFFARETLYESIWDGFEVEDKRFTSAAYAGPVAAMRDERRMVLVTSGSSATAASGGLKPVLRTFTAAGVALGATVWEGGRLVDWGWTDEQQLAVVEASGKVELYSPYAEKVREFRFGAAVERDAVAAAVVYGTGVLVVTEAQLQPAVPGSSTPAAAVSQPGSIWVVPDLRDPRPVRLASPPLAAFAASSPEDARAEQNSNGLLSLGGLGRPGLPSCVAVLDPRHTLSTRVEVLAVVGGVLWQLDEVSATDHHPAALRAAGGADHVAVSPDGAFVALYTRDHRLVVLAADLTKQLTEFEMRGAECAPQGLHWVGSDAVLLVWAETAVLVGPYGDSVQWSLSDDVLAVVPEVDGCRLLFGGRGRHELLRKVPEACSQVFRPGATGPAAQLWDARALYDDQNPRCDRILRNIQDGGSTALAAAVATAITAAGHDLSPLRQRSLMRAAAYGRPFCPPDFPRQLMYGTACRLRVLNAVRDARVGLPLTMSQLEALSLPVLVARLMSYRQWLLAYRIAGALRNIPGAQQQPLRPGAHSTANPTAPAMGQDQVLMQWACAKISAASSGGSQVDDAQLKDSIVAKLKGCPSVRYAPLAAHALVVGRRRLALRLLDEERSPAQQVPLLLSLALGSAAARTGGTSSAGRPGLDARGADDEGDSSDEVLQRALRKAIESGDTDLVYLVLFGLYRARPLPEFWSLVAVRALARNLFIKYCKAKEPGLLETILTSAVATGNSAASTGGSQLSAAAAAAAASFPPAAAAAELAGLHFRAALQQEVQACEQAAAGAAGGGMLPAQAEAAATQLAAELADVSHKYVQSRDYAFQSKAVSEMAALRREQARLERETGQHLFYGLSLVDTVRAAIRLGHHRAATAIKKQFALSDRRFTWIKVRTLAEARDWESLEGFATELRRSPIGWEPFIEAAKKWQAPSEYRARLVARLPDSPAKAEEFSALGLAREAAEVAARIKDSDLFARIQSAVAAGSPAALAIAQIKERFQFRTG